MQFGKLMVIQITSALAHSGVAIYCAYIGLSYMSLGWAAIAGTATSVLLTFVVRPKAIPYLPGIKEIKRVLSYGTYASMSSVIEHVNNVAPDWIMGKALGMQAVGLYSRAQGTIGIFDKLITSGIRSVVEPYFAKAKRDNQNLKAPYLHMVACVTVISWSFFGYLYIMALPVFRVMYGDKWDAAIPLLQIWCIANCVYAITMFAEQVFSVIGKIKQLTKVQFLLITIKLLLITYVSINYALIEVIQTFYGLSILRFLIVMPMIRKYVGVTFFDHISLVLKGGVVALFCLVVTFGCNEYLSENFDHMMLIVVSGGAWFIMFLLTLFLVKHPLTKEFINIANKISKKNHNPVL
jgi:O-antigen/teichoic acid export membrane protein